MGSIHDHQPLPNLRLYRVSDDKGLEEEVELNEPNMEDAVICGRDMANSSYAEFDPPEEPIFITLTVTDSVTGESITVSHTVD